MFVNSIKGDLIHFAKEGRFDAIVHGQNCFGSWGAGIAKSIGQSFSAAKKVDLATIVGDKKKMGTYTFAEVKLDCGKSLIVINAYTQYHYGKKYLPSNGSHLNLIALDKVMKKINEDFKGLHIAYPKIGAGKANGDWIKIKPLIQDNLSSLDQTLVVF